MVEGGCFFAAVDVLSLLGATVERVWWVFMYCHGGSSGITSSGKGVFDWRELDMLKLNKPIRRTKSLEVKTHSIKVLPLCLTTDSVCL